MENASKALLMAAGVLIGVLMLTTFVVFYISFVNLAQGYDKKVSQQKINQFNVQFTKYEGRTDLTAQDIVTVVNLAREWNELVENNTAIKVIVSNKNMLEIDSNTKTYKLDITKFLKDKSVEDSDGDGIIDTYTCQPILYEDDNRNNRVKEIKFEKTKK